jgi:hypothetical protein
LPSDAAVAQQIERFYGKASAALAKMAKNLQSFGEG